MTTFAELRAMPLAELIRRYDQEAERAGFDLNFLRAEIARRDAEEQAARIEEMTREMRDLGICSPFRSAFGRVHLKATSH